MASEVGASSEKVALDIELQKLLNTRFLEMQHMLADEHKRTMQLVADCVKKVQAASSGADGDIAQQALQKATQPDQTATQPAIEEVAGAKEQKEKSCIVPVLDPNVDLSQMPDLLGTDDAGSPGKVPEVGKQAGSGNATQSVKQMSKEHKKNKLKHKGLIVVLLGAWLAILISVDLFVRFVLDPAFEQTIPSPSLPSPSVMFPPQWGSTGQGVTSDMTDTTFFQFQFMLVFMVCVLTGLGMEFFVGWEILCRVDHANDYSEHLWFVAQFLFPIMLAVAILLAHAHNGLGLIFGIVGCYKFGFPETLICVVTGMNPSKSSLSRIVAFLNGFGTLAHHSASMAFICVGVMGLDPIDRPMFAMSMPLVVQHMVMSLKYYSLPIYAVVEICVEIWWELECFTHIEYFYIPYAGKPYPVHSRMCPRIVCGMLLAHWMYWAAAILGGIDKALYQSNSEEEEAEVQSWHSTIQHSTESTSNIEERIRQIETIVPRFHQQVQQVVVHAEGMAKASAHMHRSGSNPSTPTTVLA